MYMMKIEIYRLGKTINIQVYIHMYNGRIVVLYSENSLKFKNSATLKYLTRVENFWLL